MKELAEKVQIVINTIQDLDIKSTFSNMNRLMGAMQTLAGIRDELEKMWRQGRANCDRLQPRDEGLGGIAVYFTRQKQDRPPKKGVRKWRGSRNLKQPVQRSRDARMPNSRVKRIARDFRNEAKDVMEKLYPGYKLQDCQVRYSDIVDGVYIRCVLRRMKT